MFLYFSYRLLIFGIPLDYSFGLTLAQGVVITLILVVFSRRKKRPDSQKNDLVGISERKNNLFFSRQNSDQVFFSPRKYDQKSVITTP